MTLHNNNTNTITKSKKIWILTVDIIKLSQKFSKILCVLLLFINTPIRTPANAIANEAFVSMLFIQLLIIPKTLYASSLHNLVSIYQLAPLFCSYANHFTNLICKFNFKICLPSTSSITPK